MKNLFFYGTLRHRALLETVIGRAGDGLDVARAVLPDHAVLAARDGPFPVLIRDPASRAEGIVVRGLTDQDIARFDFYEAGFDYDLQRLTLESGEVAEVYVPAPDAWATDGPWDLDAWVRDWAGMSVAAAHEVMDGFGTLTPKEISDRFARIRTRAWSNVLAQNSRHGAGVLRGKVEIINRKRAHTNFFGLDEISLRHETFDGAMSDPVQRAVFISSDATIVLPYDPVRDRVLLVEQIRLGPIGRGDPVVWQMEPVAGLIDPGETPEAAAHREAQEEAALTFSSLEAVGECYASPGAATDFFHLFVGLCDLPDTAHRIGGEADEGENIRSHILSFDELLTLAEDRRTANAPLTLLTYWLAHHRARLRVS
ncbi:NUDIX domain-containing protein [Tateyamaria sp.]|uniref:NUDIX domain-containing protein n=1 Tax=Tateyamaria sp. TaxID=1929288 RepID=UPI00329C72C7